MSQNTTCSIVTASLLPLLSSDHCVLRTAGMTQAPLACVASCTDLHKPGVVHVPETNLHVRQIVFPTLLLSSMMERCDFVSVSSNNTFPGRQA